MKDCGEEIQSSVIIGSTSCISHREHSISNILGRQQQQQEEENQDENIRTEGLNLKKSHESSEHSFSLLYPFVEESKYPLPKCWNTKEKEKSLALTHNNLRVHYKGQGKSHKDAAAVRANYSIPAACGIYYFEIRIINKGRDGLFGIGLSQAGVSLNRLPGWDKFSYGYHGDDGHSFSFSGSGVPYGPTFSTGDIIGCGLNLIENYCFYTKNGYNIGVAFTDLPPDLYPTVGLQTPGEIIEANFGQFPFIFDIYEEVKLAQAGIRKTIHTFMLPTNKTECLNKLVSSYLVHHGYSATAESFNKMTDQTAEEESESIGRRERISKLIMSGHISDAIRLIQQYYPGLLEKHKNLLFMLKCRQFVEMVAGNDEFHPSSTSNALRDQNETITDKQQQQHQRFSGYCLPNPQLCGRYRSPTNSGANDTYPTKKCNFVSPHASPKNSPRNSPHCSSNGATAAHVIVTPSSPRKLSLPPPVIGHQLLRHKSASPSIGGSGQNENVNGATVTARSSDVSFFSNGCPKCSSHANGQGKSDNGYLTNDSDSCSNVIDQSLQVQNGTSNDYSTFEDLTPTSDQTLDCKNGFHDRISDRQQQFCCCDKPNTLLGGGRNNGFNNFSIKNEPNDCDFLNENLTLHSCDTVRQQKWENISDQDVMMGVDEEKYVDDNMEKIDDDAMDTSDCDEIIANNNAPVTAIDNNIALVHFGRELHQLSVQIFPKFQSSLCQANTTSVIETDDCVHNTESGSKKQHQTPPLIKNGSSSCAKSSHNNEHISNGLSTAKRETSPENENGNCATSMNNGRNANVKELKIMQEAFSLMAYIDPWKSPVSRQLDAEQREPIAAAVNSLIMESHGYPAKPPLEIIIAHAQRLRDEMAKASLGAAACADPMFYMLP